MSKDTLSKAIPTVDENTIVLAYPIKRGEDSVEQVRINESMSQPGSLRGLKLYDTMQMDVDSWVRLLPRVTTPALTEVEVLTMNSGDFSALVSKAVLFFGPIVGTVNDGTTEISFNCIEDVMADIATIFHWTRSELWATPIPELLDWRERASERFRAMYATKPQH